MADGTQARLGAVQRTLFFPLLARARETVRKRPLLRRRFFADTSRRRTLAASLLDEDWLDEVARQPGPFPGATLAFDLYSSRAVAGEHRMAAKRQVPRWEWACDDPSSLRPFGLELTESATVSRPPAGLRASLPARYRALLPLTRPVLGGGALKLGLFRAVAGLPR